ncbi:MAG: GIY-YIG nuclease family protein [Selenomonadaceae bacterium]|nr:GIY-YIG nuclease family protein [Selenomonadaceae bacterium]
MYGVVYLILNKINGKRYVGQTVQALKTRFNEHVRKKDNTLISNAIRKYGRENFYCGVIKSCASKAELDYWEKFFIAVLKSKKPYGYNLTDGGEGFVGYRHSPEVLAKIRETKKNSPRVAAQIAKLAEANRGRHPTPESRAKMSADRKGKPKSPEWRAKIAAANTGKQFTPERCANIAASKIGKPLSAEHRAKIATTSRGNNPFKNLLSEIESRQLTYKALSKLIEMPLSSLSYKMQGVRNFTEDDRVKLEKFFGKPADYLLERNF